MKIFLPILPLFFSLCTTISVAQDLEPATVKNMVDSGKFVFVPQTMVPSGGKSRQLDFIYDVRITKDSIVTYLPYIGKAYTGVMPNEAGVNFTSVRFDYVSKLKKKKWEISIKPKDNNDIQELQFTIFDNGQASLMLTPTNKSAVNYHGYLKGVK